MIIPIILLLLNVILINAGFVLAFLIRYGLSIPPQSFAAYQHSFAFLTLINILTLALGGVYKKRFASSWVLFRKIFIGISISTLLSIVFIYVYRIQWGRFPTGVFLISFFINLLLLFKFNQFILKLYRRIKKRVLIIGEGDEDVVIGRTDAERIRPDEIQTLVRYPDIDEIVICGNIPNEKEMSFITYLAQKLKIHLTFSPACYIKLLPAHINGCSSFYPIATFVGRKRDMEEFMIRNLDIIGSLAILLFSFPILLLGALLIKITSEGPVIYKQERVGKDGNIFTLYKFRTMINNAEELIGPVWASQNDSRVTRVGRFMRDTRLDEFPQLVNVLLGQMSLVGPRPERPFFVLRHKALIEIRLAIRPGLTGLAQIRNSYDLHPRHKIKYDYLYIQQRSFLLNLYILVKTIPVLLLKKGT